MTTAGNGRGGMMGFLRTAQGWPYLLTPFIPIAVAPRDRGGRGRARVRRGGARDHPHGGADGARHRGARRPLGARDRRPAERHLRQRAGADHRPVRARRGPARGGQGLDRRLDHRQRPAGARRLDVRRRPRSGEAGVPRAGGDRAGVDALPRRRGAGDAGDLRAGRGAGPAVARRRDRRLRRDGRAPLGRRRRGPDRHLLRGVDLLAAHPPRHVQPAVRGGGDLRLERAAARSGCSRSPASPSA